MLPEDLKEKLLEVDSSRSKRSEIAFWITKKPPYVRETLQWGFSEDSELLIPSAWVLEIICEHKTKLFFKDKYIFFERLPTIKNDTALRSAAKICEMLCKFHFRKTFGPFFEVLNKMDRQQITACCFDWLISEQKVACQVPAMQALAYLGEDKNEPWIHQELKNILMESAPYKSAGYQSRARKILKCLR